MKEVTEILTVITIALYHEASQTHPCGWSQASLQTCNHKACEITFKDKLVNVVCLLSSSSVDCGTGGQAGEGLHRHGHLHHDEPWLCWPLQPAGQPQEAVPLPSHDQARPPAHR